MKLAIYIFLLGTLAFSSCKKDSMDGEVKSNKKLVEELKSTPEQITLGGKTFTLSSYIWRDFMPIQEENGSGLFVVAQLVSTDSSTISNNVLPLRHFLIKENEIWKASFSEVRRPQPFLVEGFVAGGPKWGPALQVDLVMELQYEGKFYRILAKNQEVNGTY